VTVGVSGVVSLDWGVGKAGVGDRRGLGVDDRGGIAGVSVPMRGERGLYAREVIIGRVEDPSTNAGN